MKYCKPEELLGVSPGSHPPPHPSYPLTQWQLTRPPCKRSHADPCAGTAGLEAVPPPHLPVYILPAACFRRPASGGDGRGGVRVHDHVRLMQVTSSRWLWPEDSLLDGPQPLPTQASVPVSVHRCHPALRLPASNSCFPFSSHSRAP